VSLRRLRDPWDLQRVLATHGFRFPRIGSHSEEFDERNERWLVKRPFSSGGLGVRWLRPSESFPRREHDYLQRWISGPSISAAFVASDQATRLIGVTRQWLRRDVAGTVANPGEFQYLGSVACDVSSWVVDGVAATTRFAQLGNLIANEYGIRGLFGIDAVLRPQADGDWELYVIEVNPRYTASMEVLEQALDQAIVSAHLAACGHEATAIQGFVEPKRCSGSTTAGDRQGESPCFAGKAVVYAEHDCHIPACFLAKIERSNQGRIWPIVADIPRIGQQIRQQQPVVTVLAAGSSATEVEAQLGLRERGGLLREFQPARTG
ncbi:MAG TPA: ATP-grasp domain-containing protein, partial [Pirellulaceae bacterium]